MRPLVPIAAYLALCILVLVNQCVAHTTGFAAYTFDSLDVFLGMVVLTTKCIGRRYTCIRFVSIYIEAGVLIFYAATACCNLTYAVQVFGNEYQDASLQAIDQMLGFDYRGFMLWTRRFPTAHSILGLFYGHLLSISLSFFVINIVLYRDKNIAGRFYTAFVFALIMASGISGAFPAQGGVVLLDAETTLWASGASPLHHLEALRAGRMHELPARPGGIISFPSMHVALGLLILFYARGTRLLGMFAPPAALSVVTALTHGAHYLTDCLAAVPVVAVACLLSGLLFRLTARVASSRPAAIPPSKPLSALGPAT